MQISRKIAGAPRLAVRAARAAGAGASAPAVRINGPTAPRSGVRGTDNKTRTETEVDMFQMLPSMTFGRRLSVWWSCMWRQTLASAPVWILGVAIVGLSISRTHSAAGRPPSGGAAALAVATFFVCLVVCLPIAGYMVRGGFAAHALTAPERLAFRQALMVGLTTFGWAVLAALPISVATMPLRHAGYPLAGQAIGWVLNVAAGLYIVLPRQARRLRLLAGEAA
ncbi:hypothetical protein DIJ62_34205 [Burkholderia pseudomallei]|nr:hypothetical protein DIJ62_34205 [Burkholderia pseudomallei]